MAAYSDNKNKYEIPKNIKIFTIRNAIEPGQLKLYYKIKKEGHSLNNSIITVKPFYDLYNPKKRVKEDRGINIQIEFQDLKKNWCALY